MLIFLSLLVPVILIYNQKSLLFLLGCSDEIYPYASSYFTIYLCGTIASLCGSGMNYFILAQGKAKEGMISVILGAVCNLILDPIFIYGGNFGVRGAAMATVTAQFVSAIYVFHVLRKKELQIRVGYGNYDGKIMLHIVSIGIMSFLITLLDNGILMLMNVSLRHYGGEAAGTLWITCLTVVQCFLTLVFLPAQGISSGCGTLLGYHYGAGNYEKVMQTFRYILLVCAIYIGILCLGGQCIPAFFARMFLRDAETIAMASKCIRMYTLGLLGVAIQYAYVDGLTAMGKVRYALPLSLFRKCIYICCMIVIPMITKLEYIFYSGTISDILGASFTLVVFHGIVKKKLEKEMGAEK